MATAFQTVEERLANAETRRRLHADALRMMARRFNQEHAERLVLEEKVDRLERAILHLLRHPHSLFPSDDRSAPDGEDGVSLNGYRGARQILGDPELVHSALVDALVEAG